jgi:hypothetical protein
VVYGRTTPTVLPLRRGIESKLDIFWSKTQVGTVCNFSFDPVAALAGSLKITDLTNHCGACGKPCGMMRCARCRNIFYCDATCQKTNWKTHKTVCGKERVHSAS